MYMRQDSEMESSGLWVLQCRRILISKPKATDFHLCKTEYIYVVLRISLGVKPAFYIRPILNTAWGCLEHWSNSCAIKGWFILWPNFERRSV